MMNNKYNRIPLGSEGVLQKIANLDHWCAPALPEDIPRGDMPGDKIEIGPEHIAKAGLIFERLREYLSDVCSKNPYGRAVITVCGGSGVGKSETASLLSYYLDQAGIGSYTLSGDNYPRRIPQYNDAERLRVFRVAGIRALTDASEMTPEHFSLVQTWQKEETDASYAHVEQYPWFKAYVEGAKAGLTEYLGTKNEIDFDEVEAIVHAFKDGAKELYLKRMGRTDTELWYEKVDFSAVNVLVIEWTHGNSDNYKGVDIPILLNSTPAETLAHRRARNRDGKTDSAFTTLVLELEQDLLRSQAHKAKIIVSKAGELLDYSAYEKMMEE
jgi:hypothetical protein